MGDIKLPNPNLCSIKEDFAYHLEIPLDEQTAKTFADVKFVCIGGTPGRMRATCIHMAKEIYGRTVAEDNQLDYVFTNDRYSGFKVGAILCVSHGMGMPSVSILLHEIFKLLSYSGCCDVTIIRIGTCGGIGVPAGTVVISEEALTVGLKPFYATSCFGNPLNLPVKVDYNVINDLKNLSDDVNYDVISAKTYCADDFYQGQGRLDGSFSDSTESDKQDFLTKLFNHGVRNIEMESAAVLALTHKVGIKAAVVCVTLLNRSDTDQILASHQQIKEWVARPIHLVTNFMRSKLQN